MVSWLSVWLYLALARAQEQFNFTPETGMRLFNGGLRVINSNIFSERNRRQCLIFDGLENMFPCKYLEKSRKRPKSVHKLRPGDIDVVAGLGDSITSGVGALGRNLLSLRNEYRGVSFSTGGLDNWQKYLTLPNILKNFNPQLKGMSLHITEGYSGEIDGYNFALTGAKTFNMSSQAYRMMQKMRADPSIDFEKDWKMVTILIGHNDLCSVVCQRSSLDSITETQHLIEALDMLYYDMPRTFVNLMPISDLSQTFHLKKIPLACFMLRKYLCPCLFGPFQRNRLDESKVLRWLDGYVQNLDRLVSSGRYSKREDFTVVLQPSLISASIPLKDGLPDLDFLGPDCFHFGQRTHALIARGLWNNLIQPVGQKSFDHTISVPFLCPSKERPYLATSKNSNTSSELSSNMQDFISLMGTLPAQSSRCPI